MSPYLRSVIRYGSVLWYFFCNNTLKETQELIVDFNADDLAQLLIFLTIVVRANMHHKAIRGLRRLGFTVACPKTGIEVLEGRRMMNQEKQRHL